MIVVRLKPLEEITSMLNGYQKILIVGCDGCSGVYEVGGIKQAEMLKERLERIKEKISIETISVPRQCDNEIIAKWLHDVDEFDAIFSLGCGVGVQTIAEVHEDKPVFPLVNTKFIGMEDKKKEKLLERCQACGDCILAETGGVCPITRCAKQLLNGPCGGQAKGKCEVGGWKNDCAWILIYNRLKSKGRLDQFTKFREQRDFRISQSPREINETEEKTEETP